MADRQEPKMITLKTDGMIAEFYDRYDLSRPVNACQLFWKTFGVSVGLIALGTVATLYLLGGVLLFVPYYWHPTTFFFIIMSVAAAILVSCYYIDRWNDNRPYRQPTQWQKNLSAAYDGFKEKYCPLVTYKEESGE